MIQDKCENLQKTINLSHVFRFQEMFSSIGMGCLGTDLANSFKLEQSQDNGGYMYLQYTAPRVYTGKNSFASSW